MAKGDDARSRNAINYYSGLAGNRLNNAFSDTLVPQNQNFWNAYLTDRSQGLQDYGNIKSGFQNFANTGGFSPQDLASIRARAISPTRGLYANMQADLSRQRNLQGGYAPGFATAQARLARQGGQQISDANVNANAAIAQMVQQGKLAGMQGLLSAYGATPGREALSSRNVSDSTDAYLRGLGLQNQLSLGTENATIDAGKLPGKSQYILGDIGQIGGIAGAVAGIPGLFGASGSGYGLGTLADAPATTGPTF